MYTVEVKKDQGNFEPIANFPWLKWESTIRQFNVDKSDATRTNFCGNEPDVCEKEYTVKITFTNN